MRLRHPPAGNIVGGSILNLKILHRLGLKIEILLGCLWLLLGHGSLQPVIFTTSTQGTLAFFQCESSLHHARRA